MGTQSAFRGHTLATAGAFGILLSAVAANPVGAQEASGDHRAVIDTYCVACHNAQLKTANLELDSADIADPTADPVVWEKVIRKLRTGAMPPAGMPRPDSDTYDAVATYLETGLVPRLPTAILATGLMLLGFLGFTCGMILDTVTHGRLEMKRLAYLSYPGPGA